MAGNVDNIINPAKNTEVTVSCNHCCITGQVRPVTPVLTVAILAVLAIIGIVVLAISLINKGDGDSGDGESVMPTAIVVTATPADGLELVPTREPEIDPPDPEPGEPTGTVIAPLGANVRSGPGTFREHRRLCFG